MLNRVRKKKVFVFEFYFIIIKSIKRKFINFKLIENNLKIIKFDKELNKYLVYYYFK